MANVLFTRKNASEIPNVPITDGQLIFDTSGNGKMYLDNGTERLEMGGAKTVDATLSKTSTNPIQNRAVAGVMLDNLNDINNVTSTGFLADAMAVKELNSNLSDLIGARNLHFRYRRDLSIEGNGNWYVNAFDGFHDIQLNKIAYVGISMSAYSGTRPDVLWHTYNNSDEILIQNNSGYVHWNMLVIYTD